MMVVDSPQNQLVGGRRNIQPESLKARPAATNSPVVSLRAIKRTHSDSIRIQSPSGPSIWNQPKKSPAMEEHYATATMRMYHRITGYRNQKEANADQESQTPSSFSGVTIRQFARYGISSSDKSPLDRSFGHTDTAAVGGELGVATVSDDDDAIFELDM